MFMLCRSLFVLLYFFIWPLCPSSIYDCDYPFGIFNFFLQNIYLLIYFILSASLQHTYLHIYTCCQLMCTIFTDTCIPCFQLMCTIFTDTYITCFQLMCTIFTDTCIPCFQLIGLYVFMLSLNLAYSFKIDIGFVKNNLSITYWRQNT